MSKSTFPENFAESFIEQTTSGLIALDSNGKILICNPEAKRILELKGKKVEGKSYDEALTSWRELVKLLSEGLNRHKWYSRAERVIYDQKDNRKITLGFSLFPVKSDNRQIKGVVLIFKDITKLKQLQERIRLKERLIALGEAASTMAHEIQNPLASIRVNLDLLKDKCSEDTSLQKYIKTMDNEFNHLSSIVNRFLNYLRPYKYDFRPVNIEEVLTKSLSLIGDKLSKTKIKIARKRLSPIPPISGDMEQLRQCFLNLLTNAIEAIPRGGTISISTDFESEDRRKGNTGSVLIEISDTGIGIPKDSIRKIFDPFFTTKEKGVGLGLSIVHKIVEDHEGSISVESEVKKGTKFLIRLPLQSSLV